MPSEKINLRVTVPDLHTYYICLLHYLLLILTICMNNINNINNNVK